MRRPCVVPVGNIDRSIRSECHVRGSKPVVVRNQHLAAMSRSHRRTLRTDRMPVDGVSKQVTRDVGATKGLGKGIALVNDPADRHVSTTKILVWSMLEVPISV